MIEVGVEATRELMEGEYGVRLEIRDTKYNQIKRKTDDRKIRLDLHP